MQIRMEMTENSMNNVLNKYVIYTNLQHLYSIDWAVAAAAAVLCHYSASIHTTIKKSEFVVVFRFDYLQVSCSFSALLLAPLLLLLYCTHIFHCSSSTSLSLKIYCCCCSVVHHLIHWRGDGIDSVVWLCVLICLWMFKSHHHHQIRTNQHRMSRITASVCL